MSWTLFTERLPEAAERHNDDWISKPVYLLKTNGDIEESYVRVFDNVLHAIAGYRNRTPVMVEEDEMLAWAYLDPPEIPDHIKGLIK